MSILTVYIWLMKLDVNFTSMIVSQMLSRVWRKFMFITNHDLWEGVKTEKWWVPYNLKVIMVIFVNVHFKNISVSDQWIVTRAARHPDREKFQRRSLQKSRLKITQMDSQTSKRPKVFNTQISIAPIRIFSH